MTQTIDDLLATFIAAGKPKQDRGNESESRTVVDGAWSIHGEPWTGNEVVLRELGRFRCKRMWRAQVTLADNDGSFLGQIHALFDPEDRKLHAFEVTQGDGELVLTLYFWPGLESAKELSVQAIRLFDQALENGDFLEGDEEV